MSLYVFYGSVQDGIPNMDLDFLEQPMVMLVIVTSTYSVATAIRIAVRHRFIEKKSVVPLNDIEEVEKSVRKTKYCARLFNSKKSGVIESYFCNYAVENENIKEQISDAMSIINGKIEQCKLISVTDDEKKDDNNETVFFSCCAQYEVLTDEDKSYIFLFFDNLIWKKHEGCTGIEKIVVKSSDNIEEKVIGVIDYPFTEY